MAFPIVCFLKADGIAIYILFKRERIEPIGRGAYSSVTFAWNLCAPGKPLVFKSAEQKSISNKEREINWRLSEDSNLYIVFSEILDYKGSFSKKPCMGLEAIDPSTQAVTPKKKSELILQWEAIRKANKGRKKVVCKTGCIMDRGVDLSAYLDTVKGKPDLESFSRIIPIVRHVLKALMVLHEKYNIVHLDIKPENIVLTNDLVAKLIDFGHARDVNDTHIGRFTPGYAPPEFYISDLDQLKVHYSADMWSYGVFLINILSSFNKINLWVNWNIIAKEIAFAPWNAQNFISKFLWELKEEFAEADEKAKLIPLIERCLRADPKERITARDVMKMLLNLNSAKL